MKFSKLLMGAALSMQMMAGAAMAGTVLTHGEAGPNRGARAAALNWFAGEVDKRSKGDVKINVQWGGALFKANAAVQSVGDGVADMGTVIAVYYPKEMIGYGIADLPLNNPDAWVGMKATDELMRSSASVQKNLADKNLVYIGTFTTSAVQIVCKGGAIRTAADIAGKKVRGAGAYGKVFGELGANMVKLSIYKAYQGLDTGLINCSQGYAYAITALKQQEVIDSFTLLNWGQIGGLGILMNKEVFDGLSKDQQGVLLSAGKDMSDEFGRLITTANAKSIELMRSSPNGRKIEVITLPTDERAKLVAAGEKYIDKWVKGATAAGMDGAALLKQYRGLIAKYTAERDAKGYPWKR